MESKTILFHSNEENLCDAFLSGKESLLLSGNSNDDKWLGQGMYLWDNRGNATWWNNKQAKRHPEKKYKIVKINACTDDLLDLTDYDVYIKTKALWERYCKLTETDPNVPLGNKLNTMYSAFSDWNIMYKVIKIFGKYNRTPSRGIFTFDYNSMDAEPTMAVKCIYSIKDGSCITEKEIIKEE